MPTSTASTRLLVQARLRELIAAANVGDRLPSERDLSASLGAARMTVRRAMDSLVAEELVVRRHGSGAYVAAQPFVRALGLTSFSQDMRERGLVPGSRLLAFGATDADPNLASSMHVAVGERLTTFSRLRLGSKEPMAVETVWIPAALVPRLTARDLNGSLYELLASRYGISMGAASVTIEPMLPDSSTRDLLTLAGDQACLRVRMIDSTTSGRVVMVASCVYRGDKYLLTADISGPASAAARPRRAG